MVSATNSLGLMQAFELPAPRALVGILVGAIAGVAVFVTVVALVTHRSMRARRGAVVARADGVIFIPSYGAHVAPPIVPSTALSARAFAKMGFAFGERVEAPVTDPFELLIDEAGDADDGATQIRETYFDEPPKPRTIGDRPKIRPIAPAQPRYASSPLPKVTIPPEPRRGRAKVRRLTDAP